MTNYFNHLDLNSPEPSKDKRVIFPGGYYINPTTGAPTGPISYTQVYNQLVAILQVSTQARPEAIRLALPQELRHRGHA